MPASRTDVSYWSLAPAAVLLAGATAIPMVISLEGEDHFRIPKELAMYAVAIVATAALTIGFVIRKSTVSREERADLRLPLCVVIAGVAWTAVAALTSTNGGLSLDAFAWIGALAVIFLVGMHTFRFVPLPIAAVAVLTPALVNAAIVWLQALRVWNPWVFPPGTPTRSMNNALLGNPNDVGMYIVAPVIFALAAAMKARRGRLWYAMAGAALATALLPIATLTAIVAAIAGAIALAMLARPRAALAVSAAVAVGLVVVIFIYAPTRQRVTSALAAARTGEWGSVVSGRLIPAATAWRMFTDHPVTGVGPGAFRFHYMPYRVEVERENPQFAAVAKTQTVVFAQAHNDHAQILAEAGLPGYAVALVALVLLGSVSFGRRDAIVDDARAAVSRRMALPLTIVIAMTMLTQFPWHLAAPAYTYTVLAAACFAWRPRDVA